MPHRVERSRVTADRGIDVGALDPGDDDPTFSEQPPGLVVGVLTRHGHPPLRRTSRQTRPVPALGHEAPKSLRLVWCSPPSVRSWFLGSQPSLPRRFAKRTAKGFGLFKILGLFLVC
jgi:hypothetical protein